jgi:N-acetylmuramoyl-L-alanine amidase
LAFLLAVGAGCNGPHEMQSSGGEFMSAPLGTISIYQLAGRLDMDIADSSRNLATLTDSANTLVIYADPAGQVFLNGRPVGRPGGITPIGDTLFIPKDLEPAIVASMRPRPRRAAKVTKPESRTGAVRIVLDAGHGGKDPGAISPTGLSEKIVVLDTTLALAGMLKRRGLDVRLTRGDDTFIELNERAAIANRLRANLFVSIHADSCPSSLIRGLTIYVARAASRESLALADSIGSRLRSAAGGYRGVRRADFRVLVRTSCPAVLVELGYLSNISEAGRLSQHTYRAHLATAICEGILDHLKSQ